MENDTKTIKFRSSQVQLENYPENYGIFSEINEGNWPSRRTKPPVSNREPSRSI